MRQGKVEGWRDREWGDEEELNRGRREEREKEKDREREIMRQTDRQTCQ